MATFTLRSAAETAELGRSIAAECARGTVIALAGDLGAGKTHFVKGLAAGLSCEGEATSPTFTLIHEYAGGRFPLYHFDFYRIENSDELNQLGIDEYFDGGGVCVVEWADRFRGAMPARARWMRFTVIDENSREIEADPR